MATISIGRVLSVKGFGRGEVVGMQTFQGRPFYWVYLKSFGVAHLFSESEIRWGR